MRSVFRPEAFEYNLNLAIQWRESGAAYSALNHLRWMKKNSLDSADHDQVSRVTLEILVCYQHLALTDQNLDHIRAMLSIAQEGLETCQKHPEAIKHAGTFEYRIGVGLFSLRQYSEANPHFLQAVNSINTGSLQYPEFASYYGASLILSRERHGDIFLKTAIREFERARQRYHRANDLKYPGWHADIVDSGISLLLARVSHFRWLVRDVSTHLNHAQSLADRLKDSGRPLRFLQVQSLKDELESR